MRETGQWGIPNMKRKEGREGEVGESGVSGEEEDGRGKPTRIYFEKHLNET